MGGGLVDGLWRKQNRSSQSKAVRQVGGPKKKPRGRGGIFLQVAAVVNVSMCPSRPSRRRNSGYTGRKGKPAALYDSNCWKTYLRVLRDC